MKGGKTLEDDICPGRANTVKKRTFPNDQRSFFHGVSLEVPLEQQNISEPR